jgi:hypothetical protein
MNKNEQDKTREPRVREPPAREKDTEQTETNSKKRSLTAAVAGKPKRVHTGNLGVSFSDQVSTRIIENVVDKRIEASKRAHEDRLRGLADYQQGAWPAEERGDDYSVLSYYEEEEEEEYADEPASAGIGGEGEEEDAGDDDEERANMAYAAYWSTQGYVDAEAPPDVVPLSAPSAADRSVAPDAILQLTEAQVARIKDTRNQCELYRILTSTDSAYLSTWAARAERALCVDGVLPLSTDDDGKFTMSDIRFMEHFLAHQRRGTDTIYQKLLIVYALRLSKSFPSQFCPPADALEEDCFAAGDDEAPRPRMLVDPDLFGTFLKSAEFEQIVKHHVSLRITNLPFLLEIMLLWRGYMPWMNAREYRGINPADINDEHAVAVSGAGVAPQRILAQPHLLLAAPPQPPSASSSTSARAPKKGTVLSGISWRRPTQAIAAPPARSIKD